jgi:hypothetical protein
MRKVEKLTKKADYNRKRAKNREQRVKNQETEKEENWSLKWVAA